MHWMIAISKIYNNLTFASLTNKKFINHEFDHINHGLVDVNNRKDAAASCCLDLHLHLVALRCQTCEHCAQLVPG